MLRRTKGIGGSRAHRFQGITEQECFDKVGIWLQTMYEPAAVAASASDSAYSVAVGSALTLVRIAAVQDEVVIQIVSRVVSNANLTQDLLAELLRENFSELPFASFALSDNGDIWLKRTLMGNCTKSDFTKSMKGVAETADEYDDFIRQHWGGNRAIDRLD